MAGNDRGIIRHGLRAYPCEASWVGEADGDAFKRFMIVIQISELPSSIEYTFHPVIDANIYQVNMA